MRQRLYVDTTGWYGRADDLSALPAVQDALSRDRKLQITYAKPLRGTRVGRVDVGGRHGEGENVSRVIDPLGLVAKGATWYLVAQTSKGYRTFRVSRITSAAVLEARCERPAGFDLATHWTASTTQFIESRRQFAVTLRMAPAAADRLKHWFHHTTVLGPSSPADQWIVVQVKFDDEDQASFVVLGFGRQAEVLEPASLRDRVDDEIAALASRSDASGGSGRPRRSGRSDGRVGRVGRVTLPSQAGQ